MIYYVLLLLFLAALVGGFIAGLVGIGGGVIYVFIYEKYFYYFYETSQFAHEDVIVKAIIANSVFSTMVAGLMGAWKNYRIGHFYPKLLAGIALPAVFSSLLVTYLLSLTHAYSLQKFSIVFSIILIPFILKVLLTKERSSNQTEAAPPSSIGLAITGLICGSVTALTGLGGGVIVIPALNGVFKFPIRKTIAISLGVIGIVSAGLTIYNLFFQYYEVDQFSYAVGFLVFPMLIPVIIGVLIATSWGVNTAQKLPAKWLKTIFVLAGLFVIGNLLYDAFLLS